MHAYKSKSRLSPIPQSPEEEQYEEDQYEDVPSDHSNSSSWKSGNSRYSTASSAGSHTSLNNNLPETRPTTSYTISNHPHCETCHRHGNGHHACSCIRSFYEDDEVCRINSGDNLEFGIVSRLGGDKNPLKIFWTLGSTIEEQDIEFLTDDEDFSNLRLLDRKCVPGDIIYVNKKRGEVLEVSWTCHLQILENNMSLLNIPCENLEPLIPHYPGQKLEYSGWIGTIINVSTEATLMFTSAGVSGVIDCSSLPINQQPFPGRKVRYTINQFIEAKLRFIDDNRTISQIFVGQLVIEAFVLFLNVNEIKVRWNGRVKTSSSNTVRAPAPQLSSTQPPATLTKSHLKKHAKVFGTIKDVDWEACHDATEKYFQYTVRESDLVVRDGGVEEYIKRKYFEEVDELVCTVKEMCERGIKICTNMLYNVKVIRFSRSLKVKWSVSGKIEKIPASMITSKHTFDQPFHQLVQRCLSLSPYTYDEYGVTLSREPSDIVLVQWIGKTRENSKPPYKFKYNPTYQTPEPAFNLEPHFVYGSITPRTIVFRSMHCRVPEALFTLGWVRSVTTLGTVTVVSVHTRQEHALYPIEIESTGMKLDEISEHNFKLSRYTDLVRAHGLEVLRKADKLFIQNLSIQSSSSSFPDHFQLLPKCPTTHTFYKNVFSVRTDGTWMRAVKKDQLFLTTRMNEEIGSIWIKGFRDRLDLFSVLISAPPGTPYEGGLFSLDLQLTPQYPTSPPAIYLHTGAGKLLPGTQNLELEDLKAPHSLVESIIALQCKLFTSTEGFEIPSSAASLQRRKVITKDSEERLTNAHIIIDILDLIFRLVMDPPRLWSTEIINYFHMTFERNKERLLGLIDVTNPYSISSDEWIIPTFPLMPVSDGFTESIISRLKRFEELIEKSTM